MTFDRISFSVWFSKAKFINLGDTTGCLLRRYFHRSSVGLKKPNIKLKGRKTSSQQWLQRQFDDPYVKRAQVESYRCRSAFKLLEIDDKHHVLLPGLTVVDCGAAPGSWTQVSVERVNSLGRDTSTKQGFVIGVDIQHMLEVPGATVLSQTDFTKAASQKKIQELLAGEPVDVILSDMAPKASGLKSLDHEAIIELSFSVLQFAKVVLKEGGSLLCKIFQGNEQQHFQNKMSQNFKSVKLVKPPASRTDSAEIFLLGKDFKK